MTKATRRGFLAIAGGVVAAPTAAAKEVAAKMGLVGPFGAAAAEAANYAGRAIGSPEAAGSSNYLDRMRKSLANLMSPTRHRDRLRSAREAARIIDPDLACMRSLSPTMAYRIQIDRTYARMLASERSWLEETIEEHVKGTSQPSQWSAF